MKTEETVIRSSYDELGISTLICRPETAPKAVVQFAHGMCEHKERYIPFMKFLCDEGYACVIHDHRGHGRSVKSEDDLGFMYEGGWEAVIDDIRAVNRYVSETFPGCRIHLFGHSMGSLAVRCFAKRHDDLIDSLIVCGSPSANPATGAGKTLTRIIAATRGERHRPKLINSIAFEEFNKRFSSEGHNAWLSTDKDNVREYNQDPHCGYVFTANGFISLFSMMQDCYCAKGWKVSKPDLPILFIAGKDDPCITDEKQFGKAVDFIKNAGYGNTGSIMYEGLRHEILNETQKEKVWSDVLGFLERNN